MKLARATIPPIESSTGNAWTNTISASMLHDMKMNPGTTFQLMDDDGKPHVTTKNRVSNLVAACPKPYRVQSRPCGASKKDRHVWVSMDPAHWEKVAKRKGAKR